MIDITHTIEMSSISASVQWSDLTDAQHKLWSHYDSTSASPYSYGPPEVHLRIRALRSDRLEHQAKDDN